MPISYAGLPAKRCSTCSNGLFSRFGNSLRCGQCSPLAADEKPDEWLEARYERGVLRWAAALPPAPPTIASAWLYVADNLDWFECEPADETAEVWHFSGRWYCRLDRRLLGWLAERVFRLERHSFPEDFRDALAALRELVARAINVGVFPDDFADESRWPRAAVGFDPYSGLFDPSRITFPGLAVARPTPVPGGQWSAVR